MKKLSQTKQFARDVKRMRKRGKDLEKLQAIVASLARGESFDPKHRDHALAVSGRIAATATLNPTGF